MKDSSPSNPLVMPCPFCGKPAQEGPLWPKHYGCSDSECGAYMANVALVKWNRRPADETNACRCGRPGGRHQEWCSLYETEPLEYRQAVWDAQYKGDGGMGQYSIDNGPGSIPPRPIDSK